MQLMDRREALEVHNSDLSGSHFSDAKLKDSCFNDVDMRQSIFTNANLADSRFVDVNLSGTTIQDANVTGMKINGWLLSDLIRAYESRSQAVIYARNLARMQPFYQDVFLFHIEHAEPDHVVLTSAQSQLTIVQVPASIASTITISDPPQRRRDVPVKLIFEVKSISVARSAAQTLGGSFDPVEREWTFDGRRVCDGVDPEGNVVQLRQQEHR